MDTRRRELRAFRRDGEIAAGNQLTARCRSHAEVSWLTGAQRWAVDVVLEARMKLSVWGAVFLRGETGTFSPYLPSGAYL